MPLPPENQLIAEEELQGKEAIRSWKMPLSLLVAGVPNSPVPGNVSLSFSFTQPGDKASLDTGARC